MVILEIYSIVIISFLILNLLANSRSKNGSFMMVVILYPILVYILLK